MAKSTRACSLLFLLKLLNVKLKLLAFENITIKTARLSWARADACKQVVGIELIRELNIHFGGLSTLELGNNVLGSLAACTHLISFFNLLLVELNVVVLKFSRPERSGVNAHDGVLDESLGADELVVCGIIDDIDDTSLA